MTDQEILRLFVQMLQIHQNRDEMQVMQMKFMTLRIGNLEQMVANILRLTRLPDSAEKDTLCAQILSTLEAELLRTETRRTVARIESQHELQAAMLAAMQKQIEDLG